MSDLLKALEDNRPAIEAALADAESELADLQARERELKLLINRAKAALGYEAPQRDAPAATRRLTLHEAIERVLAENENEWLTVTEIASQINDRRLYQKRDGSPVEPSQIHARAKNYTAMFEKDGPRIRLRAEG